MSKIDKKDNDKVKDLGRFVRIVPENISQLIKGSASSGGVETRLPTKWITEDT
jgi:hypothetical protein